MKIQSYFKTPSLFLIAAFSIALISNKCNSDIVNDIKKEVLSKDSLRYKRVENEAKNHACVVQKQIWQKELVDMNDSLLIDSIAKRAYFEGAQMVRDSVNNSI